LFACGGAMAIEAVVFDEAGGFDPEFFAYYEDVDLGWRMWVLGHAIHYVPSAECWHHHSSTSKTLPPQTCGCCKCATRCSRASRTTTTRICAASCRPRSRSRCGAC